MTGLNPFSRLTVYSSNNVHKMGILIFRTREITLQLVVVLFLCKLSYLSCEPNSPSTKVVKLNPSCWIPHSSTPNINPSFSAWFSSSASTLNWLYNFPWQLVPMVKSVQLRPLFWIAHSSIKTVKLLVVQLTSKASASSSKILVLKNLSQRWKITLSYHSISSDKLV